MLLSSANKEKELSVSKMKENRSIFYLCGMSKIFNQQSLTFLTFHLQVFQLF